MQLLNSEKGRRRMEASTRNAILIAALVLLMLAVVLRLIIGASGLSEKIASELREHGCQVASDELFQHVYRENSTISEVMQGVDMEAALAASIASGFPSDMQREGELYMLFASLDDERVLTVFVIDERVELAFIQVAGSDDVFPVDNE